MAQGAASDREAVLACRDEFDAVLAALSFDALTPAQTLEVLARREVQARRQPSIDHRLLNRLVADGVPIELGATSLSGRHVHREGSSTPAPARHRQTVRTALDAILAKLAAPGMCNADDETPCVRGIPTEPQIRNDQRTASQRNHDGLLVAGRIVLATKNQGELNGLPVTVIVSTTLAELENAAGQAARCCPCPI